MSQVIEQSNKHSAADEPAEMTALDLLRSLLLQLTAEYRTEREKFSHMPPDGCLDINVVVTDRQYSALEQLRDRSGLFVALAELVMHSEAAALRSALDAFVEGAGRLHTEDWQPLRYELQLGRAALRSDASEKWLKVIEAARRHRDAARRSGADETGGRTLKELVVAVDALDVF